MQYTLVSNGDESVITVFIPGEPRPYVAQSDHPNFKRIVAAAVANDVADFGDEQDVIDLFDVAQSAAKRFDKLSERVTVANGRVYFDGDEVDSSLTKSIVRFLDDGVEDWKPLVAFFENVADNPCGHSRSQLYDWLNVRQGITLTPEGYIVGYKGVGSDGEGNLVSGFSGTAIVDGEQITGKIPNRIGSTIEMPRSEVAHDPGAACSRGLHVGTFEYAQGYAQSAMLECHVNPRDVVSVPTDASGEKIRVCRYTVVDVIDKPHDTPVLGFDPDFDSEYEDDWAEYDEGDWSL